MWRGSCGHPNAARGSVAASGDVDARRQTMSIQSCSRLVEWARRAATGEDSLAADRRSRDGCGSRRVGVTHAMARTLVLRDSESGDGAGVVGELPATSACVVSLAGVVGLRAPVVPADAAQQMFGHVSMMRPPCRLTTGRRRACVLIGYRVFRCADRRRTDAPLGRSLNPAEAVWLCSASVIECRPDSGAGWLLTLASRSGCV
jgi:hypothetical protein